MNAEDKSNYFKGQISNVQIQQNSHQSVQQMNVSSQFDFGQASLIFEQLRANIENMGLDPAEISQLRELIENVTPKLQSKTDETFITKSLSAVKEILVNASGNLVAGGILYLISKLEQSL